MSFDRNTTAAFTGHRTYTGEASISLRIAVATLHARGVRTFLCGMAVGFDLAAAEAVLDCREHLEGLRLVAVIPFEGQQARFSPADQARYARIREAADEVVCLAPAYFQGCYLRRNDFLVDSSSVVIAWCDTSVGGTTGGTQYTVRRAERLRREVMNLHPQAATQQMLF